MPRYLFQASYTPDSWATQVKSQPDPVERVRPLVESCGGRLDSFFYCFGDYDGVVIYEAPDSNAALSMVLAVITPGHLRATKTTELFTMQEMTDALKTAGGQHYSAPGQQ